jgi:hypothetical protein
VAVAVGAELDVLSGLRETHETSYGSATLVGLLATFHPKSAIADHRRAVSSTA